MADSVNTKITSNQMDSLKRDLSLDLTSVFNLIEGEVQGLLKKAVKENWTPDELIKKVEELI